MRSLTEHTEDTEKGFKLGDSPVVMKAIKALTQSYAACPP